MRLETITEYQSGKIDGKSIGMLNERIRIIEIVNNYQKQLFKNSASWRILELIKKEIST